MEFSACRTVLIANRGEIACRIIRTCKKLGLRTIVLSSSVDLGNPAARFADMVIQLPGASAAATYLNSEYFLPIAKALGATAVHPGYGFLSENAEFAARCAEHGLTFIGPSPEAIIKLGNKVSAKAIAQEAKVPMAAHCELPVKDRIKIAKKFCKDTGFPIVVKAAGGGGGRGMRLVKAESELEEALSSAAREAEAFFKDPNIFLEQYVFPARHIEVQLLGDKHGNVYAIGDRDCTFQRRYQKVIEEAPAPNIDRMTRSKLHKHAVTLGKSAGYYGAGTVEFLLRRDEIFFLEVNSRLQVEHPVTEMAFGLDLVEQQIRIACGEVLSSRLAELAPTQHAIELRLTSEEPERGFAPSTGSIVAMNVPSGDGIRVDSGFEVGSYVSHYYDSLIAKLIFTGKDRDSAIGLAQSGLRNTFIGGVRTNSAFLEALLATTDFAEVKHHITQAEQFANLPQSPSLADIAAAAFWLQETGAGANIASTSRTPISTKIVVNGSETTLQVERVGNAFVFVGKHKRFSLSKALCTDEFRLDESATTITISKTTPAWIKLSGLYFECNWPSAAAGSAAGATKELRAPLPGRIVKVNIAEGQVVTAGEALIVIESMKMEHVLKATTPGAVKNLRLKVGAAVQKDDIILTVE